MSCATHAAGTIELYFYGELTAADRAAVQAHLKQCAECRGALEDLTVIRAALATRPDVATPPGGDWSAFMARLSRAIEDESRPHNPDTSPARVVAMPLPRRIAPYFAMAALLALVTFSVVMVFRVRPQTVPVANQRIENGALLGAPMTTSQLDPALVSLSGQHFERSKLVVLGLTTKDASNSDAANWAYERQLASALLTDTRLYRIAAEERGMNTLAGVMRDLELVLLQTSMSEQPDAASLEQLQRLIRRRDLLTKMNVVARQ